MLIEQMSMRLKDCANFEDAVELVLDDMVALQGAECGDLQLAAGNELLLVAQRGLPRDFLEFFRRVTPNQGCVCGRALRTRTTIVVFDVEQDSEFAPYLPYARIAGYRAVQSTPLISPTGIIVGMASTKFKNPHRPTAIEIQTLSDYSPIAADRLLSLLDQGTLSDKAEKMCEQMFTKPLSPNVPPIGTTLLGDQRRNMTL
jgi:hypothetical protein